MREHQANVAPRIEDEAAYQAALAEWDALLSGKGVPQRPDREKLDALSLPIETYELAGLEALPPPRPSPKRDEVSLNFGRVIRLMALSQERVYEGVSGGLPTRWMNEMTLHRLQKKSPLSVVLRPRQTPLEYRHDRPYPFGVPAELPPLSCIGRFYCHQPARDRTMFSSFLTIIWFQDDFAFPIAPDALRRIQAVDWERHAEDDEP